MKRQFRSIPFQPVRPPKKNPFVRPAGSALPPRGTLQAPQTAPANNGELGTKTNPNSYAATKEWISLKLLQKQQHSHSDFENLSAFRFAMPRCLHGVALTPQEASLEWRYVKRFLIPVSFECFDCNPCCQHGTPLDEKKDAAAIKAHQRISKKCPECDPSITNPKLINAHLYRKGLNVNAAKGLIEGCVITSFGQVITKGGEYFAQGGSSNQIEKTDANTQFGGNEGLGPGPDGMEDVDGITVDDLGDPLGGEFSEFIMSAEKIRTTATRDTLEVAIYAVAQNRRNRKWYVVNDGDILTIQSGETLWFKTKAAAEKYINRQLIQEAGKNIEHNIDDVLPQIATPADA
jgi:hypothetical protein